MSSFKLSSDNSDFNNRVDALFSCLQTASVDLKPSSPPQGKRSWDEDGPSMNDDVECSSSTISIGRSFRKPIGVAPRWRRGGGGRDHRSFGCRRNTPDYMKNPQNWTCYSMEDTKVSSDSENKRIGLELYDELRSRRNSTETDQEIDEHSDYPKIIFKKPVKSDKDKTEDNAEKKDKSPEALFGGTKKFRMNEYEVGISKQKNKTKTEKSEKEKENKRDNVRLDYLTYEDEEEDE